MSRYAIAYVGPSVMTSVANVRETPYLTSSQVIGEPSSHVDAVTERERPGLAAVGIAVPVSVARSGTSVLASLRVLG